MDHQRDCCFLAHPGLLYRKIAKEDIHEANHMLNLFKEKTELHNDAKEKSKKVAEKPAARFGSHFDIFGEE